MKLERIVFSFSLFCAVLSAQEIIVSKMAGSAYLAKSGTEWQKITEGMLIEEETSITTNDSSYVILNFSDGHTIEISANSIFTVKTNSISNIDLDVWLGEIYARVKKLPPSEKFNVRTPAAVCAVRGTKFRVAVGSDKKTDVYVDEGIVGVMDSSGVGEEVFVREGEMSSVPPGQKASEPVKKAYVPKTEEKSEEAEKEKKEEKIKAGAPKEPEVGGQAIESFPEEAEEKPTERKAAAAGGVNMNGSIGAVALTRDGVTKVYYEFSMFPELTFGKLGVGLELVIHFDENNEILKDEWYLNQYPSKIDYLRWGQKHQDPFYFLIGRFRKPVTIGHGMIVDNYTNMAQYPNVRKIGLEFDLDRGRWGMEGVTGDIVHPKFGASRVYFRPLLFMGLEIPLLKNLKLAASAGSDTNPDFESSTKNDEVSVIGADAELPLLSYKFLNATVYADWAKMAPGSTYTMISSDGLTGRSYGLTGKIFFLSYRGEYRVIDNNFIPGYFDAYYDIDRWKHYDADINGSVINSTMTKAAYYLAGKGKEPVKTGPYVQAWFSFFNLVNFKASYENYNTAGKNDPYYPHLIASAALAELPGLSQYTFEADYDKRGARNWSEIKDVGTNAILTTKLGYSVAPNVTMYIVVRRNYDSSGKQTKTMTAETRMKF